jgi:hypothetical protein
MQNDIYLPLQAAGIDIGLAGGRNRHQPELHFKIKVRSGRQTANAANARLSTGPRTRF